MGSKLIGPSFDRLLDTLPMLNISTSLSLSASLWGITSNLGTYTLGCWFDTGMFALSSYMLFYFIFWPKCPGKV